MNDDEIIKKWQTILKSEYGNKVSQEHHFAAIRLWRMAERKGYIDAKKNIVDAIRARIYSYYHSHEGEKMPAWMSIVFNRFEKEGENHE